ncbi:MAG TPA: ABC transporter substrate-binding protein [Chthoniobacteraceae bacterium]|nr:ABC transporter substrate-binding protein [Chthoniobacteraceae bacterium]
MKILSIVVIVALLVFSIFWSGGGDKVEEGVLRVRIGHFPNVTHAQALVAHHFSRQGKGWFEQRLGPGVKVEWFVYNAGPSAMEAIFARSIDVTYVGPSPAINAFARSDGSEVRIVAGAADGGAALVVPKDSTLKTGADFRGKKIATPQLGNTQDVACRAWLTAAGLKITQLGGDAHVLPTANADQLGLFTSGRVDGVWTVEPWVSRLELEGGGKILVDEKKAVTTVLVSSVRFAGAHPELLRKIVAAHAELTEWINANPEEAQRIVVAEMEEVTRSKINPEIIAMAWPRMTLTSKLNIGSLKTFVKDAREAGFLPRMPPVENLLLLPAENKN